MKIYQVSNENSQYCRCLPWLGAGLETSADPSHPDEVNGSRWGVACHQHFNSKVNFEKPARTKLTWPCCCDGRNSGGDAPLCRDVGRTPQRPLFALVNPWRSRSCQQVGSM